MPAGRPTKYSKQILEDTKQYIGDFEKDGNVVPSIASLARRLGVRRETLHVWSKQEGKEEFSNILEDLLAKQEELLLNKGLTTEFNSNIVKLALGKHGYKNVQSNEYSGSIKTEETSAIDTLRQYLAAKSS